MKEYIVEYQTEQIEESEFFYGGKVKQEVVRCKDCIFNRAKDWVDCFNNGMFGRTTDNFCSRGEKNSK